MTHVPFSDEPRVVVTPVDPDTLPPLARAFTFGGYGEIPIHACSAAPRDHIALMALDQIADAGGKCSACGGDLP